MNDFKNLPPGVFTAMIAVLSVFLLIGCLIYFLYVKNLQDTLNAIRPQNRKMPSSQIWFLLINLLSIFFFIPGVIVAWTTMGIYKGDFVVTPVMTRNMNIARFAISAFILVWHFRIVTKIADSIALEYASRNMQVEVRPAYQTGLIYCICSAAAMVISFLPVLKWLGTLIGIAGFVFWILYWVKTATYKKALRAMPANPDEESSLFRNQY